MNMKIATLTLGFIVGLSSFAKAESLKVFCVTKEIRGAMFLNLDSDNKKAFGRISNPWTRDWNVLKEANPPKDQYNNLFVAYVEETADGLKFNASPYVISSNTLPIAREANELSKSFLSIKGNDITLKHFIDVDRYLTGQCEIVKW